MMFLTVELIPSAPIRALTDIYSPELKFMVTCWGDEVAFLTAVYVFIDMPWEMHSL